VPVSGLRVRVSPPPPANFAAAKFVVASSLEKRKKIQAEKQKLLQNTNYTQKYNFIL